MTTRDVLGLREFRLLFAGHGVSVFGDRMVAVALAFAVLELGGSVSDVGLVLAASWVPAVASVLVGGVIPPESLSRVASYDWFGSYAVYPIGLAIWGPLAGVIGIHTALWLASGLFLAALVGLLAVPDIRRLSAYPRAQTPVA